nr:MAG TPA: hypothetical protein [Caudoviricetes sp.]
MGRSPLPAPVGAPRQSSADLHEGRFPQRRRNRLRKEKSTEKAETRLDRLKKLRDTLALAIDTCESMRDLSSLARQYRETLKDIEEIEGGDSIGDEIGEILAQRKSDGKPGAVRKNRA